MNFNLDKIAAEHFAGQGEDVVTIGMNDYREFTSAHQIVRLSHIVVKKGDLQSVIPNVGKSYAGVYFFVRVFRLHPAEGRNPLQLRRGHRFAARHPGQYLIGRVVCAMGPCRKCTDGGGCPGIYTGRSKERRQRAERQTTVQGSRTKDLNCPAFCFNRSGAIQEKALHIGLPFAPSRAENEFPAQAYSSFTINVLRKAFFSKVTPVMRSSCTRLHPNAFDKDNGKLHLIQAKMGMVLFFECGG